MSPLPQVLRGYAALTAKSRLEPVALPLGEPRPYEVIIAIEACGVCHSDVHLIDDDWGMSQYPLVPGHEILGRIVQAGADVPASHAVGTYVGVGWQRGACGRCPACLSQRDNLCATSRATCVGWHGGYADLHRTGWQYAFVMPASLQRPEAAPLLCAGLTVFSPLQAYLPASGGKVGIVGLGGLGHLAVRLAVALGHTVTVFTSSASKQASALAAGASQVVDSADAAAIVAAAGDQLDLVLVTAAADLPWAAYIDTLAADGTLCFVGIPPQPISLNVGQLLNKRRKIVASPIGNRQTMIDLLALCDQHQIVAQTEQFALADVNTALDRVRTNQVRYRAVLVRQDKA